MDIFCTIDFIDGLFPHLMRSMMLRVDCVLNLLDHLPSGEQKVRELFPPSPPHEEILEFDVVGAPLGHEVGSRGKWIVFKV